jgi:hypothetical protein
METLAGSGTREGATGRLLPGAGRAALSPRAALAPNVGAAPLLPRPFLRASATAQARDEAAMDHNEAPEDGAAGAQAAAPEASPAGASSSPRWGSLRDVLHLPLSVLDEMLDMLVLSWEVEVTAAREAVDRRGATEEEINAAGRQAALRAEFSDAFSGSWTWLGRCPAVLEVVLAQPLGSLAGADAAVAVRAAFDVARLLRSMTWAGDKEVERVGEMWRRLFERAIGCTGAIYSKFEDMLKVMGASCAGVRASADGADADAAAAAAAPAIVARFQEVEALLAEEQARRAAAAAAAED